MSPCEAKWLHEVLVHGGSRKTNPPRKLAHRRKRKLKFGKSREHCLIDRTAFHTWSFGKNIGKLRVTKMEQNGLIPAASRYDCYVLAAPH
jgi:hypothetical protein